MRTPTYLGTGQPIVDSGGSWFGRLGMLFGGSSTPNYAGKGQPVSSAASMLSVATPAYAVAADAKPAELDPSTAVAEEQAVMSCPIDPEALAAGSIAIVIPRQGT